MGAGAGYTIKVSNVERPSTIDISDFTITKDSGYCTAEVPCNVKISATLSGGSYYDSIGEIEDVALTVSSVVIALGFGNGFNEELLTSEAIAKYEAQFGADINDLWRELVEVVEPSDIDINFIREEMSYGINYEGEARLGGGWVGSTFDGTFTAELDGRDGSNELLSATMSVDEKFVTEFIDKAKYGDNQEYTAYYNGDILESYTTLDEAVEALKNEILEDPMAADLYDCYVECARYYLVNGSENNWEYETDYDYATIEYNADSDPDFDFEALAEAAEELNEENDVGIDEDFDI